MLWKEVNCYWMEAAEGGIWQRIFNRNKIILAVFEKEKTNQIGLILIRKKIPSFNFV